MSDLDKCDGATPQAVASGLMTLHCRARQGDDSTLVEIASRTARGPLRREIERFITSRVTIPWQEVKEQIINIFLPADEAKFLRDQVEATEQSPFESEPTYNRRFREIADRNAADRNEGLPRT